MPEEKSADYLRQKLNSYLEENGLRKTAERYAILNVISDVSKHFDAEYIWQAMLKRNFTISLSTVYNTLSLLVKASIITEQLLGENTCYERVTTSTVYGHLVCTQCGKIKDIKDAQLAEEIKSKRFGRFSVSYCTINIYGLCSCCSNAKRKAALKSKQIVKDKKRDESKKRIISENKKIKLIKL